MLAGVALGLALGIKTFFVQAFSIPSGSRAFVVAWPVNRWATLLVPGTFERPGALGAVTTPPLAFRLRRRHVAKAVGRIDHP
ncbi:hypothetical protein O3X23_37805 [Streptomyces sp. H39-S7]|nr:hypothetical protein [Streptomyces sp. H39-S7]MCZ4125073.1 hypothetical protein [Streptomyces sp. H39-S7]